MLRCKERCREACKGGDDDRDCVSGRGETVDSPGGRMDRLLSFAQLGRYSDTRQEGGRWLCMSRFWFSYTLSVTPADHPTC